MADLSPIPFYIGYDWVIPVTLTDDAGQPLDISTWTLAGDFWTPFQVLADATVLPAEDVDLATASFRFRVPRTLTALIQAQDPKRNAFPCRVMVKYTDAEQNTQALRPIFILPLDPRSSPQ